MQDSDLEKMIKMKKNIGIVLLVAVSLMAVSCFKGTYYKQSITEVATFRYNSTIIDVDGQNSDSLSLTKNVSEKEHIGSFPWNGLAFFARFDEKNKNHEGGFTYSRLSENTNPVGIEEGMTPEQIDSVINLAKHRAYGGRTSSGKGYNDYLVWTGSENMPDKDIIFLMRYNDKCSILPTSVSVANTNYNANLAKEKFTESDRLVLRMQAYKNDSEQGDPVTVLLAGSHGEKKDSVMRGWHSIDLGKFGDFDNIKITVESTNEEAEKSFCMDDFAYSMNLEY